MDHNSSDHHIRSRLLASNLHPQSSPSTATEMAAGLLQLLLLSLFVSALSVASSQTEEQILLQIKEEWGYPPALQPWNASTPHCNWTGISCSADGSVTGISLRYQGIAEPIPAAVCSLKNLAELDLFYNKLPGPFPTSLYNCTSLRRLEISQNLFVGPIPSTVDHLSRKLSYLGLSANNFSGDIPSSLGRLSALQYLLLDNNLFNGTFPAELGNLSSLQSLCLAYNPFAPTKIPAEFGNMTSLANLWMTSTNLVGEIPGSFAKLTNLVHLDLALNSLSGEIPAGIWMLERLEIIYLYHNELSGDINKKNIGARSLVGIDLSMNKLTGPVPVGFSELKNLQVLFLYFNQLSGEIPPGIGLLPSLTDLRLFNNKLTGILPPELGKHSSLWNFEVDDNSLSGELPQFLCAGGNLTTLVVSNNNLTGNLPSSLGSCRTLNTLMVHNNSLYGEVPAGLWSAAVNLTTVMMSHNSLSGALPDELPWNLTRLEIQSNKFSGNIPSSAKNLVVFRASNNLFSGAMPANLAKFSRLQSLALDQNQISGEIPNSISSLRSLTDLNLSRNHLSGEIPAEIASLLVLTTIDLSDNQLTGQIPAQMGNMNLIFLNLSSNDLSGEIPAMLQTPAYDESFLTNPKLCSSNSLTNIRVCGSKTARSSNLATVILVLFIVLGALFLLAAASLGLFMLREHRRRKRQDDLSAWKLTSFHSVEFNESNIKKGLTSDNLIGSGGAGLVYKIVLGNRTGETLAVKKIWNSRKLDSKLEREFEAEVQILGSIRHANIVKLLCCISSSDSKLLVYEYMENGSLDRWLHSRRRADGPSAVVRGGSGRPVVLDWPMRLAIAIGAAKGLCYMHHGCSAPIVHRDIKSSNILLDLEFNAKIADFGLARMLVKSGEPESVSAVAGSFGYIAPECGWLRKVNEKVDVYSFGVVLLELTTGREANYGDEHSCLADWAWRHFQEGGSVIDAIPDEIRDPAYLDEIAVVLRLGIMCTGESAATRPSMKEVLQVLQRCDKTTGNGLGKETGPGEYDAAPLLRAKWGSRRQMPEVEEDSYV